LILGLVVNQDNSIIATENGPRGGDEINKIIYGGNYGWPIASYGRRYDSDYEDNPLNYKEDHSSYGYKEPIFSFIPSIGISEIIKIPNEFLQNWVDNYLLASLNKRALFRVKFDKNKEKLLFYEEIYIGSRIRDLKYSSVSKSIFLALEDRAELGILREK
jgi:glucose/arabinose dehydrogenase